MAKADGAASICLLFFKSEPKAFGGLSQFKAIIPQSQDQFSIIHLDNLNGETEQNRTELNNEID